MGSHRQAPLALAAAFLAAGCGGGPETVRDLGTRAVVIGIDGADWQMIEALGEDALPNFFRLRQRSAWGRIETLHDIPLSPVIWTSVATGKTAAEHGISWFLVDRPDGTRVPIRSHNRRVKAIWNILAEHARRPVVVGWWATFPAEEVGEGAIVSDALGFHGFGATARGGDDRRKTYPTELFEQVNSLVPPEQQLSHAFLSRFVHLSPEDYRAEMFDPGRSPRPDPKNPIHLFQLYATTARGYTAIAEELLESRRYDLFLLYFEQVDSFSHLFMKYAPPRLDWIDDDQAFGRYRDVVAEWYRYQDELLGRVLARIDLDDTAVFVLSDHGFKSGGRRIRSEDTVDVRRAHLDHETHGVFAAAGPHIRRGVEIAGASVLDLTPTLLHYLGFPVAKDMDGKVLEDLFEEDFRQRNPIRYVTTYEDAPPAKVAAQEAVDPRQAERQLEALSALGYVGGSPAPTAGGDAGESSPEVHNNLGRVHLRAGDLEQARREFGKALELDPRNAEALLNLASLASAEGNFGAAEHLVERALQVDPNSIGALAQLAEIERDRGDLGEAVRLFEEALGIDDSQPFLHLGYGDALQRAGRLEQAERAFRTVLELDPDSFKAHYNLGVTYAAQGRVDDAVAMYEKALAVDPDHTEAVMVHNNLGAIHLERGDTDRARERFEQAVRRTSGHLESRYNLALIYLESGRLAEAIELLEEAAAAHPNHELLAVRLGMAYLSAGRGEDAQRSFLLLRRLYPENWVAPLGLAVLHARAQQPEEAGRLLEEALRRGGQEARAAAASFPLLQGLR